jgi:hypothetical protein
MTGAAELPLLCFSSPPINHDAPSLAVPRRWYAAGGGYSHGRRLPHSQGQERFVDADHAIQRSFLSAIIHPTAFSFRGVKPFEKLLVGSQYWAKSSILSGVKNLLKAMRYCLR